MRVAAFLVFLGCGGDDEDEAAGDLYSSVVGAVCRLQSDPTCVEQMGSECSVSISYDSQADCETFMAFAWGGCDELDGMLDDVAADAEACVAQLDAFTCGGSEPICDENGTWITATGPCAAVDQVFNEACADTGEM
jgi:hypothetical protein